MTEEIKNEELVQEEPNIEAQASPSIEELQAEIARLKAEAQQTADKYKKSVSEACADASEWKRKYRATLDESERTKQEQAEKYANMENELNGYKVEKRINTYFAKLVGAGYSPEVAQKMAEGLPEGVPDTFFEEQKAFFNQKTQEIKAQVLNSQPSLSVGMPPSNNLESDQDTQMRKWFGLPTK